MPAHPPEPRRADIGEQVPAGAGGDGEDVDRGEAGRTRLAHGVRGPAPSRHRDPVPGPAAASSSLSLQRPPHAASPANRLPDIRGRAERQRAVQPRHAHERGIRGGAEGAAVRLLHLPRRRPAPGGRQEPVHVPGAAEAHVGRGGQVQVQVAVRRPIRRRVRDVARPLSPGERIQQRVLGLGRRGRRHGEPDQSARPPHLQVSGERGSLQDAHAQEGEGEPEEVRVPKDREEEIRDGRADESSLRAGRQAEAETVHVAAGDAAAAAAQLMAPLDRIAPPPDPAPTTLDAPRPTAFLSSVVYFYSSYFFIAPIGYGARGRTRRGRAPVPKARANRGSVYFAAAGSARRLPSELAPLFSKSLGRLATDRSFRKCFRGSASWRGIKQTRTDFILVYLPARPLRCPRLHFARRGPERNGAKRFPNRRGGLVEARNISRRRGSSRTRVPAVNRRRCRCRCCCCCSSSFSSRRRKRPRKRRRVSLPPEVPGVGCGELSPSDPSLRSGVERNPRDSLERRAVAPPKQFRGPRSPCMETINSVAA